MATLIWQLQGGTASDDGFNAVAMGSDGSSLLAGYANQNLTASTTVWTAMKLDADGTILWEWQDEIKGDDSDLLFGAAMGQDGSVALAGTSDSQFQVIKLDADGSFMWRFEDGTGYDDYADGIGMGDDGSVVVAGGVGGEWGIPRLGGWDFAAFKLDVDGNLLWMWQDGTAQLDKGHFLAMADDGSVVIAGESSGEFMDANATVSYSSSYSLDEYEPNFVAIKLDSEGIEVWRWQDGPRGEDSSMRSVSMTEDGGFVLAGRTDGAWNTVSSGGLDFVAVKLDADGNELWKWQGGTSGNDLLEAVAVQADGTIVLGGYTEGDWGGSNAGGNDFAIVALNADGEEIWRWQDGSPASGDLSGDDYLNAMAASSDGRIVLGGKTFGSFKATNLAEGDYVAVMLNTSALPVDSTTTSPPSAAETSPPSAAETSPPSAAETSPPSGAETSPPSAAETSPLPSPTTAPTISSKPSSSTSSDTTLIIAGVVSAFVGVAVIALGCFLWKRHTAKNNHASNVGPFQPEVVDNGEIRFPLPRNPPPPSLPPSYAQVVAVTAATECIEEDGGAAPPSTEALYRGMPPAVKPTTNEIKAGAARRVSVVQQVPAATANADKDDRGGGSWAGGDGGCGDGGGGDSRNDGVPSLEGGTEPPTQAGKDVGGDGGGRGIGDGQPYVGGSSLQQARNVTNSTVDISTGEGDQSALAYEERGVVSAMPAGQEPPPAYDAVNDVSSARRRGSSDGLLLGQAVATAAQELARNCHIPGVCDAAAAVSILARLVMDNRDCNTGTEPSLRRCRSIVLMLKRAAKVLGKGGDTTGKAERAMMEDVHDAVFDLVELIRTYQSKNKLSQVMMSTLFRRRQDEMGAVVDRAILGLQLGLHVQVGNDVSAVKQDVGAVKDGMHLFQGSIEEAQSKHLVEARKARRQRKLDQIEIPEEHIAITGELLGKGGFGEVFLADYNGRNAAAKVLYISHDLCRRGENTVLDGSTSGQLKSRRENDQRRAFLRELDAMTRLRSPYTVNVYGAVTCLPDRLVLVMELLSGGDLRTLLSNCEHPLAQQQSRQILGDICAGMAFLHSKEAVHGDVKSANVLLDGAGRAKIGDFGTSRWTHHTMSTGLATFTTKSGKNTQMSLAWSAPEVLHASRSTYASDVYSFGIVVWEVLSRQLPWETVTHPRDIFIRVVLNDLRPTIPDDAPAEIADVATACWVSEPGDRPTFSAILEGMKANGWNE